MDTSSISEAFRDRRVSVIGAARSGVSVARILTLLGAKVLLSDSAAAEKIGAERRAEIVATGARFLAGATVEEALPLDTDLVVTSPGVPRSAGVLQEAVRRGIPVWSEVELAYRLAEAPLIAVTGTNGKTTTTMLIAAMLEQAKLRPIVAGNISADEIKRTLVDAAFNTELLVLESECLPRAQVLVAEISSFQLEWVERFAPRVAILTNITPDHLNRYDGFDDYAQTKARIFAAQGPDDWAILNYDNPAARRIGESGLPGKRLWFTTKAKASARGPYACVKEDCVQVRLQDKGEPEFVLPLREFSPALPGRHSVENVLAAAAAALAMGAVPEVIAQAVRTFPGVAHRMEFVREVVGVRYVNNSMCTNVAAAISSLQSLDIPGVIIMGGADKGLDFAPLVPALKKHARQVFLIGQAAEKMEHVFREGGYHVILHAGTLEEAVLGASMIAKRFETVLLCPACASFDMFRDFEERGAAFRRAVNTL
ncbi:MAG: UDP-N-acetylmuramoyl-L-alanine--D-glutamate ligase [Chthonomonadales bacterium]|nr:UDP-N-acetylmuramoyl-L-alanine--D-glutamate ligase [Chthonomonadales bacterium]